MHSRIFYSERHHEIERDVSNLLDSEPAFLTPATLSSTRATGDAIEQILARRFEAILGDLCSEFTGNFARRAMADFAFTDVDGCYYAVDVKTHRSDTTFNMPNLTSVKRLAEFYEDERKYFALLMIRYRLEEDRVRVERIHFVPIEFLSWECLTIGALGWGQIQIANANRIVIDQGRSRRDWMLELCDVLLIFYPEELSKIEQRIRYFESLRERWTERSE